MSFDDDKTRKIVLPSYHGQPLKTPIPPPDSKQTMSLWTPIAWFMMFLGLCCVGLAWL